MACFSILRRYYDVNQSRINCGSESLGYFGNGAQLSFSASKLPKFMETNLIRYIGGLLVLALFSNANAGLGALYFTIAATITVQFLADITSKVNQLFGGGKL